MMMQINCSHSASATPDVHGLSQLSARFAQLNQVTLVMTKARILGGRERVASVWWAPFLALANNTRVLVVPSAPSTQEESCFDASATNLHVRGIWIAHVLLCKFAAKAQGTVTSASSQHWLIFNENLLVVVQRQFFLRAKSG